MPLISIWEANPKAVAEFKIEQVVSAAGDGNLTDNSDCSTELRDFLTRVPSTAIADYIGQCLSGAYKNSGMVLQDLVNEVGRRLDYEVTNGRYQGIPNAIGFDGIWKSADSNDLVVEVKTTDTYRMSLNTIATYRSKLIANDSISEKSSILIVVGRKDTGELEAQIRGSRHAWDIRLISADSLLNLLKVKENSGDPATGTKIRSLFTPVEYTRLDGMVDIVFTAATDVELPEPGDGSQSAPVAPVAGPVAKASYEFTDSNVLQAKRIDILRSLGAREGATFLQKSRAQYWDPSHELRVVCSLSKRYEGKPYPYWYAYHPPWDDFLADGERSFFVLGCMDLDQAFAIPRTVLQPILPKLHQTIRDTGAYWHIHLTQSPGGLAIVVPGGEPLQLAEYAFLVES
jgi:hypothetical protein